MRIRINKHLEDSKTLWQVAKGTPFDVVKTTIAYTTKGGTPEINYYVNALGVHSSNRGMRELIRLKESEVVVIQKDE